MICQLCGKKEATIHFTKIVNGVKKEFEICEDCAKSMEGFNVSQDINFGAPFSIQNVINGLMDYLSGSQQVGIKQELQCPICKTTYSDFKNTGLLGCSNCYKTFNETLMPMIKRVQGNVEHVGKVPQKSYKELVEKRKLIKLKEELNKAILAEEYEKAAVLRDEIRNLKKGGENIE